jgi:hypothetical protein
MNALGGQGALIISDERQIRSATELFNASAPFTISEFDDVVLVDMPEGNGLILYGRAKVICLAAPIPANIWGQVKLGILGRPA